MVMRLQAEERALQTVLLELEDHLEEARRDLAFHRLAREVRPDLERRHGRLRAECERLARELVHVRLALAAARDESPTDPDATRIPA
ncbi:MAG: hypothetical protein AB7O97_17005 [Planctomycetota bacterium]